MVRACLISTYCFLLVCIVMIFVPVILVKRCYDTYSLGFIYLGFCFLFFWYFVPINHFLRSTLQKRSER